MDDDCRSQFHRNDHNRVPNHLPICEYLHLLTYTYMYVLCNEEKCPNEVRRFDNDLRFTLKHSLRFISDHFTIDYTYKHEYFDSIMLEGPFLSRGKLEEWNGS